MKKLTKIIILMFVVIVVIVFLIFYSNKKIEKNKSENTIEKVNVKNVELLRSNKNINYDMLKDNIENCNTFNDRVIYKKNYGNIIKLYIGENEKELQNSYYDICIEVIYDKEVNIYINKLWKKTLNSTFYEEEYVKNVASFINEIFNLELSLKEETYLKENIIKNYRIIKNNLISEGQSELINLQINDLNFKNSVNEGELKLNIDYIK